MFPYYSTGKKRGGGVIGNAIDTVFTNMVAVLFYLRVFFYNNAVLSSPGTVVVVLLDEQRIKV